MRIAYYRVSTGDQSIDAQRIAMGGGFDKEFSDEGVSGGVMAADRPGFAKLLEQVREGDAVSVYAVDRLGRDALDVQGMVRRLIRAGVTVDVHGLGPISGDVGELILAVLAQIADMERRKIRERTEAGRAAARVALVATGRTHKGKESLGRPKAQDGAVVAAWRLENAASIRQTAEHFGISPATVKRYSAGDRAADPLSLANNRPEPSVVIAPSPLNDRIAKMTQEREAAEERARQAQEELLASGKDPLAR
jgi:putative DNA-invertase from lambdoid prophage Rac